MKKIICLILVIIMLIPVLPTFAAGDTSEGATNAYFKVGNGYYSTLKGALEDAPNASDKTIYLLKDAKISEKSLTVPAGAEITIDFGGHTLDVDNKEDYLISAIKGNLILKNGTINLVKGMVVMSGGHLIIDSMSYNINNTSANARPAVKLSYQGNTTLTVRNSRLKTVGPGESLVLAEFATDATVNLEGNTILEYAGVIDSDVQNCGAVAIQQGWGTGFDSSSDSANTDIVLNVGANAKIINTAPAIDKDYTASAIVMQTRGDVVLNLEKGATLEIDRTAGKSKSYHIASTKYTANLIVNDNGANWAVSAKTASGGNFSFINTWTKGYNILGWTDGVRLLKAGAVYTEKGATKTVNFFPVVYTDKDFYMLDGAAIRTSKDEKGIRFSTVVSESLVDLLGTNGEFGTLIVEGSENPANASGEKHNVKGKKFVSYDNNPSVFHAALFLDGDESDKIAYKTTFSAVSYMTVTYYDGSKETLYTNFTYNNVRSIRDVAENLSAKGMTYSVLEHILSFFGASSTLAGYCTVDSLYTGKFDGSYWHAAGMGYAIKTGDGKLIAIDGGNNVDAEGFYNFLKKYSGSEKVVVDYWILTHPHGDHVNALVAMAADPTIAEKIEIKNLVFHFPTDFDSGTKTYNEKMQAIAAQYGANVINPTKGQVIYVGDAKITFLYVIENYKSVSTANKISLIFTVEAEKKIMFTGDIYEEGLKAVYNEYGSALKCDILQMPHHFLCDTGYQAFYEAVDASAVLLPTCIAGYEAMYNQYKNNSKHKMNDWAAQNADMVYKAFDGDFEIKV